MGTFDVPVGDPASPAGGGDLEDDAGVVGDRQLAFESPLAVFGHTGAQPYGDGGPDEAAEMLRPPQAALYSWARDLELVAAPRHGVRLVERVRDGRGGLADGGGVEARAPVDRDFHVPRM